MIISKFNPVAILINLFDLRNRRIMRPLQNFVLWPNSLSRSNFELPLRLRLQWL